MGTRPDQQHLARALALGFEETFGIVLKPTRLSAAERDGAAFLARERCGHERWTVRGERELPVV